ncbi:MAG: MgtC/SapB family protein [Clostridia bacterium]|nr:MgtC/SapB family protein [Clostridia bacterium]
MFSDILNQHISILQYLEFFLRIAAATACGAAIGMERSRRLKEAGVRTHLLVSCAAALFVIISKYGFSDLTFSEENTVWGVRGADPARIAAQVVSGISFLCAGVIFKQGPMVRGLTTAAGLWATAGIGLALGAGMYPLGLFCTGVVLLSQIIMHRLPVHNDLYQNYHIEITTKEDKDFRDALSRQFQIWQAQVIESSIKRNQDGSTTYSMEIKMNNCVKQEEIFTFLEQNSSVLYFRHTITR